MRQKSYIKQQYREVFVYLSESKKFIWFSAGFFLFSIIVGFLFPIFFVDFVRQAMADMLASVNGLGLFGLITHILMNNLGIGFLQIISGVFFGIFPLISLLFNGYAIGFISNFVVSEAGLSSLWLLIPHGIFELPAIILSMALGIRIGFFIFSKNRAFELSKRFILSLKTFIFVIIPLLILAAIIEGFLITFFTN